VVWLAWLLVGIFPITPLEGDEQGVIQGATAMANGDALAAAVSPNWTAITDAYALAIQKSVAASLSC